jgi:hypothetical protein
MTLVHRAVLEMPTHSKVTPMQIPKSSLTLVNHASVLIKGEVKAVLTDPWYEGEGFHKGWRLIHENSDADIRQLVRETSHIWISHEHPDHFAIGFFKKYKKDLIEGGISIIFQETKDKRVVRYLQKEGLAVNELAHNQALNIEAGFSLRVIKDEFYDSALICNVNGTVVFNLNDCPMHSLERIEEFKRQYGVCDILLTQFSYAAWKGGRDNRAWRITAAQEKLSSLVNQGNILEAKVVVPFASYVWFSNELNFYLNDSANKPQQLLEYCHANDAKFQCLVLQPFESMPLTSEGHPQDPSSLAFWQAKYQDLDKRPRDAYSLSFDLDSLTPLFGAYCERLKKNNSWSLVRLIGKLKVLGAFAPISVKLIDTGEVLLIDLPAASMTKAQRTPDIALHSESLAFIFRNAFGFDTLTVNGTFEELQRGGFGRFTKNFAIENMNNLGYSLRPALFFNFKLLSIFAGRLAKVAKKLR